MNQITQKDNDSYRKAVETYKVLLTLNVILFKLLLLWCQLALLIRLD